MMNDIRVMGGVQCFEVTTGHDLVWVENRDEVWCMEESGEPRMIAKVIKNDKARYELVHVGGKQ